jgi:PKD repeat protein
MNKTRALKNASWKRFPLVAAAVLLTAGMVLLMGCSSGDEVKEGSGPLLLKAIIIEPAQHTVIAEGAEITFVASVSGGTEPYGYSWTWNDRRKSNFSSEQAPTVVFPEEGVYAIYLTIKDGDGYTDSDSVVITVQKIPRDPGEPVP